MELPRGCDYWRDKRMLDLLDDMEHFDQKFDGCMYGLQSKRDASKRIRKPWRIVSWGVEFDKLQSRCDKSHEHVECAGSETKKTQTYT